MKKPTILIIILLIVTTAAVSVTVWALFFRDDTVILAPDYAPIETEPNAETIPNDSGNRVESPQGGGSVSLSYSTEVTIDLSEGTASLYFGNPGKSNHDMVLQIVIQDTVILQSGRLTPGNQVMKLDLLSGSERILQPGGYDGILLIFYYNQQSGEKAMVNTEIPVSITVKE